MIEIIPELRQTGGIALTDRYKENAKKKVHDRLKLIIRQGRQMQLSKCAFLLHA